MSFFTSIGHFFESLFGKSSGEAQKVLHNVSSFVQKAEPIVAEVETVIKAVAPSDKSGVLAAIEKFLSKYEPDLAKVASTAATLAPLSGPDLFKAAATTALSLISPAGTAASLLNLAVELAYSIFKQKAAAQPAVGTAQPPKAA